MTVGVNSSQRRTVAAVGYQLNQSDCLRLVSLIPAGDRGKDRFKTSKQNVIDLII